MRGRFTPDAAADEWCERRLLARIHRYTVKRLRAEIEPVAARDFLRFLFAWQRVAPETRMEGPDALEVIVGQLEGFEAPAGAWETEILPARLAGYEPSWLDDQCLAGRVAWARLRPRNRDGRTAATERAPGAHHADHLAGAPSCPALGVAVADGRCRRGRARARRLSPITSAQHGASFFDELVEGTGLLRPQVEEALAELVALGLVSSDSFAGLRALLVPSDGARADRGGRRRRRTVTSAWRTPAAGHWRAAPRADASRPQAQRRGCRACRAHPAAPLRRRVLASAGARGRHGCRHGATCCASIAGSRARGEIRGGRFVAGFSGEQFALPDAVGKLREIRRRPPSGDWISLSGADPLNLVGVLTPGPKLAALTGNRLLYRDGIPVALFAGGEVRFLAELEAGGMGRAQGAAARRRCAPACHRRGGARCAAGRSIDLALRASLRTRTDHTGIRLYQTTNHNLIIGHVKHMVLS